jgi:hypothetical protein
MSIDEDKQQPDQRGELRHRWLHQWELRGPAEVRVVVDGCGLEGSHITLRAPKIIHNHLVDPEINLNSDVVRNFVFPRNQSLIAAFRGPLTTPSDEFGPLDGVFSGYHIQPATWNAPGVDKSSIIHPHSKAFSLRLRGLNARIAHRVRDLKPRKYIKCVVIDNIMGFITALFDCAWMRMAATRAASGISSVRISRL